MTAKLVCWKCGIELQGLILPLSRREVCADCNADQHVCKLCRHYDVRIAGMCREERAEDVTDKERANFCDYFDPVAGAYKTKQESKAEAARNQLADLFGGTTQDSGAKSNEAQAALKKLFGDGNNDR